MSYRVSIDDNRPPADTGDDNLTSPIRSRSVSRGDRKSLSLSRSRPHFAQRDDDIASSINPPPVTRKRVLSGRWRVSLGAAPLPISYNLQVTLIGRYSYARYASFLLPFTVSVLASSSPRALVRSSESNVLNINYRTRGIISLGSAAAVAGATSYENSPRGIVREQR